jgi:FAD/FMN-containing dehydrogenase
MSLAETLRARVACPVLEGNDEGYNAARAIWNRLYDQRPALIVRPATTDDVAKSITFGRERELPVAIKCGGHQATGYASIDGGLLVDLSAMRSVSIHPGARTIRTQSGLTWAHFDQLTQAFGLASTGPIVSMTGISGFTLGGGFGWLHRKAGLGCDNLRSAEVVLADGMVVRANETENPDLLWGLRGSGWNFGVVTSMEFSLHPIGPQVVAGLIYFPLDEFPKIVKRHRELLAGFPDELTAWFFLRLAPPVPVIPKNWVGKPVVAIAMCHCGKPEDGQLWSGEFAKLGTPIVNTVAPLEYRTWQRSLDGRWGNGYFNDWRGQNLEDLSTEAVDILMEGTRGIRSPWTDIKIAHMEGAVSRIAESATAYGSRSARFSLVVQARWEHGGETETQLAWSKGLRDRLTPYATGGVYANFIAADEQDRVPAAHGPDNYLRLRALKAKYDPTNFFRVNVNIPPAV